MKRIVLFAAIGSLVMASCSKGSELYEGPNQPDAPVVTPTTSEDINANVQKVFGVTFDPNHDWISAVNGKVTIIANPTIKSVQVIAYVSETNEDGEIVTSMNVMNEAELNGETSVTLTYDAPTDNLGLYVAFISYSSEYTLKKVEGNTVTLDGRAKTRALPEGITLPTGTFAIGNIEDSYANTRGWVPGEKLYQLSNYRAQQMIPIGYDDVFTATFRAMVFSYFKNGRNYNNLPLVKSSEYYNEKAYPFTTGSDPIIISPVYKSDKATQYGNEVWNSDLYYYYFKDEDMEGKDPVEFLQSLPKYMAIPFKDCFEENEDDVIRKDCSYALLYYGDGTPEIGTEGSYTFPKGYKIGFMVRAKTDFKENGKARKQGELYGDGRLNNDINSYSECNFKSSKLGTDGPRLAWLTFNGKKLMCWESGTDSDFNDVILEVEGGIDIPFIPVEPEYNTYTFCFEDTQLGDYDINDIVVKAVRKNQTTIEYSIVACGAHDDICVRNINSGAITDNAEVHALFGVEKSTFINTVASDTKKTPVTVTKTVAKEFSFLVPDNCPYIYDMTHDLTVKLSKKGEDPHGIMIPNNFKYPLEKVCVKDAYAEFNNWGEKPVTFTDWYTKPITGKVYE